MSTSPAFLSSLSPRYTGWRRLPSAVHSVNLTCATSDGFTQWVFSFVRGALLRGLAAVSSGFSSLISFASSRSLKPVPTRPAYRRSPSLWTPSTSAPRCIRVCFGSVQPATTNSCSERIFSLRQSGVRLPEWYTDAAFLTIRPSQPSASARSCSARPSSYAISLMRSVDDVRGLEAEDAFERLPALGQRTAAKIRGAVAQDVEADVGAVGRAALQVLKARGAAFRIERDDLAVEHEGRVPPAGPLLQGRDDRGELCRFVVAQPRPQLDRGAARRNVGDGADAVVLRLVDEARTLERRVHQ